MKSASTAVLADLDSTIADTRQRWHLSPMADPALDDPALDWVRYSKACVGDVPLPGTIRALKLHWTEHQIHLVSGSGDESRKERILWLRRHKVPYDYLRLRPPGDSTPNGELKVRYIEWLRERGIEVLLFYEDWPEAARLIWEKTGVPVLGVNPFYPEDEQRFAQGTLDGAGGGL